MSLGCEGKINTINFSKDHSFNNYTVENHNNYRWWQWSSISQCIVVKCIKDYQFLRSLHSSSKATKNESSCPSKIPLQMLPMGIWGPENMKIKNIWWRIFDFSHFLEKKLKKILKKNFKFFFFTKICFSELEKAYVQLFVLNFFLSRS